MSNYSPHLSVVTAMPIAPVIVIMGPTASGKSEIAIQLAKRFQCEIISVDSVMIYRNMDIGTAKPSLRDRSAIPHYLIDILDPHQVFSAGEFCVSAHSIIREVMSRNKIPLLVGGTMLYFNALLNGLSNLPSADTAVRQQIEEEAIRMGWGYLHQQLATVDSESAKRIHPNDPQRIQRALEVYRISGRSLTELCGMERPNSLLYPTIRFIIEPKNRSSLHRRIEKRFVQMVDNGLISEVQKLRESYNLNKQMPSVRAVGYRQVWEYLDGAYDKETMVEKAIAATRQLAKRQLTWLRRDLSATRFYIEDKNMTAEILKQLEGCANIL